MCCEQEAEVVFIETLLAQLVCAVSVVQVAGTRICLARQFGVVHVASPSQFQIQPVREFVFQRGVYQETVAAVAVQVVFIQPVRVQAARRPPVHRAVFCQGIAVIADVYGGWKYIDRAETVGVVVSGHRTVLGSRTDILYLAVETPTVILAEGGRGTQRKVRTVQTGTRNLACVVHTCGRRVDTCLAEHLGE